MASDIVEVSDGQMPAPDLATLTASDRPFYLGSFDRLNIAVFGVPELSGEVQTDANGQFSFPLIGAMQASGKTPMALGHEIEARLAESYIRDPAVTVNLVETTSNVMTVGGQVTRPGQYPVMGRMTLLRAVTVAGGAGEYARPEEVIVIRETAEQRYIGVYNLTAISRGNYADPDIYANDVIIVGDSPQLRLLGTIAPLTQLVTTPLLFLTRL